MQQGPYCCSLKTVIMANWFVKVTVLFRDANRNKGWVVCVHYSISILHVGIYCPRKHYFVNLPGFLALTVHSGLSNKQSHVLTYFGKSKTCMCVQVRRQCTVLDFVVFVRLVFQTALFGATQYVLSSDMLKDFCSCCCCCCCCCWISAKQFMLVIKLEVRDDWICSAPATVWVSHVAPQEK